MSLTRAGLIDFCSSISPTQLGLDPEMFDPPVVNLGPYKCDRNFRGRLKRGVRIHDLELSLLAGVRKFGME